MTPRPPANLIWLDLEMSGLNPQSDVILELALIATDSDLNILEEFPPLALHQPEPVFAGLDDWNRQHHGASGLIDRCRASGLSTAEAEARALDFVQRFVPAGQTPLCGNSIGQDRRFLIRYMPTLERHFHYRNVDVSTVKELARRWYPELGFTKTNRHEALSDIRESIAELRFYRAHLFK